MVWIISILACIVAFLSFVSDWQAAQSAPQQCVAISMALLIVILPYCLSKAIMGIIQDGQIKRLNETLETHTRLLASMANTVSPITVEPESVPKEQ